LRHVSEDVAVFIDSLCQLVAERDALDSHALRRAQFPRLRFAVLVGIGLYPQLRPNRVARIDPSIAIAALAWQIIHR
jgi:hypothetical protein